MFTNWNKEASDQAEMERLMACLAAPCAKPSEVISSKGDAQINYNDLRCLLPGKCINGSVINFYYNILQEERSNNLFLSSYFLLWLQNMEYRVDTVQTKYKKYCDNIFDMDMIFVPMCVNQRWSLCVIHLKSKFVDFLDAKSIEIAHTVTNDLVLRWLRKEADEKSVHFDRTEWGINFATYPLQSGNEHDCGVFILAAADVVSLGLSVRDTLLGSDLNKFRGKVALDIASA